MFTLDSSSVCSRVLRLGSDGFLFRRKGMDRLLIVRVEWPFAVWDR